MPKGVSKAGTEAWKSLIFLRDLMAKEAKMLSRSSENAFAQCGAMLEISGAASSSFQSQPVFSLWKQPSRRQIAFQVPWECLLQPMQVGTASLAAFF